MLEPLPDIVARYIHAYNTLDVDGLVATMTDDVVFENISNTSNPTRTHGKAALEKLARGTATVFQSRHQLVTDAVVSGDQVALVIKFEAVVKRDLPNGWRAGQTLSLVGASFFTLRDGLIAHVIDLS